MIPAKASAQAGRHKDFMALLSPFFPSPFSSKVFAGLGSGLFYAVT
jgi:hypothetical protein